MMTLVACIDYKDDQTIGASHLQGQSCSSSSRAPVGPPVARANLYRQRTSNARKDDQLQYPWNTADLYYGTPLEI